MSVTPPPLSEEERLTLQDVLGAPAPEQVSSAIEEVERQVALEDLVLLLLETAAGAARAFFDILVEVASRQEPERPPKEKRKPE